MKTLFNAGFLLMWTVLLSAILFGQGGNGTLTGTVEDSSKALIPGVTITAINVSTGVVNSAISNEAGSYSIPSLLPGTYRLTATLPGFQTQTFDNIPLGTNESKRFNFTMQVASVATSLEVTVDASTLLTTNTATVGEVLGERKVQELPLVTGDVLDLVRIMPGVRFDATGQGQSEFAGLTAGTVNTVRDGLSVTDGRNLNGIYASSTINPDLVGEIRLILTPVDAELGRGNGQVQITTRSGTNRYTGAVVWNNRNTSLNANTWANNGNRAANGTWSPLTPNWSNENQITASFGGPIIQNKTFFFALYDRNFHNQRFIVTGTTLTDQARQGIFRFWEGWNNGHAEQTAPADGSAANVIAVVDLAGNPVRPFRAQGAAGGPYTGSLRCLSVFGATKTDGSPFTAADCPGGTILLPAAGTAWDPNRPVIDPTGFIRKYLDFMPRANYFGAAPNSINPDGLNTAAIRWLRGNDAAQGQSNALVGSPQLQTGTNISAERKQINIKIDQNFNTNHKASVGYTYETSGGQDLSGFWPTQFQGETKRRPTILTSNFTSTLSPNLLNEFRFGIRRTTTESVAAWDSHNQRDREGARSFFVFGSKSLYGGSNATPMPAVFDPAIFTAVSGVIDNAPFDSTGNPLGDTNPLYNFADTIRWTRAAHALRIGGELRLTQSKGWNSIPYPIPRLTGGAGNLAAAATGLLDSTQSGGVSGLLATNATLARNLLYFMAGSIGSGNQGYWVDSPDDVTNGNWEDYITKERKYRDQRQNEFAGFFQDDWKVSRNVTLNLGLRYEYYGVPYLKGGFTSAPKGLGDGLFGVGRALDGSLFDNWLYPGNIYLTGYGSNVTTAGALRCVSGVQQSASLPVSNCDAAKLTALDFVGPDSPNPDLGVYRRDTNNFGPVVGFAWQVPWFGEGKTTVRGGASVTYGGSGRNGAALDAILGGAPGATHTANLNLTNFLNPDGSPEYLDLTDLPRIVPITPTLVPGGTFSVYGKTGNFTAYDPNWKTPYTYNFNLSLTRNLLKNVTLDVRYVATQGKALSGNQNLNEVTVFNNKELFDALEIVRAGGDAPLFDQMFAGLNLNPNISGAPGTGTYGNVGTVNASGILQTGSMHLRRWQGTNLANGNYEAIALAMNGNGAGFTFATVPAGLGTVGGRILRNGCDRVANGTTTVQTLSGTLPIRCFPENYLVMNPQLGTPTYINNTGFSNYNSLQTTVTVRPTFGISLAGTYTWSKTMSLTTANYVDFRNRDLDYGLSGGDRTHEFRANGAVELPFGPNKVLLGNTSGWVARLIERWQASFIFNSATGAPASITGVQTLWNGSAVDVVAPFPYYGGSTEWGAPIDTAGRLGGTYFGSTSPFMKVDDPQCAAGGLVDRTDAMGFNLRGNTNATTGAFTQLCTNDALALAGTGQILLQNARPGKRGNLGTNTLRTAGSWTFDASLGKTFRVTESKSAQVRIDTTNVLNHPTPANPTLGINSNTAFGLITGAKTGSRTFRGSLRLTF